MKQRRAYTSNRFERGTPPELKDVPVLLATISGNPCPKGSSRNGAPWPELWQLWLRARASYSRGWYALKLCAAPCPGNELGMVYVKANYWLGWHAAELRWAEGNSQRAKLISVRPALYAAVELVLKHEIKYQFLDAQNMVQGLAPQGGFATYLPISIATATNGNSKPTEAPSILESSTIGDPDGDLL